MPSIELPSDTSTHAHCSDVIRSLETQLESVKARLLVLEEREAVLIAQARKMGTA